MRFSHRRLDPYTGEVPRNAHYDVRYPPCPSTASKHGVAQAFPAASFQFPDPEDSFAEFIRGPNSVDHDGPPTSSSPTGSEHHRGPRETGLSADDIFAEVIRSFNDLDHDGPPTSSSRTGYPYRNTDPHVSLPKAKIVEIPLPLTLEELFAGTRKKMKIIRHLCDKPGEQATHKHIVEMGIKPGLMPGFKFNYKFKGVGDLDQGQFQGIHFIVSEVGAPTPLSRATRASPRVLTPHRSPIQSSREKNTI